MKCPECDSPVEQCDVSGDYLCTECDWWIDQDEIEDEE